MINKNTLIEGYKDKKVLVTGCAGFIGSHIVDELLFLGSSVIGIDDFSNGYHRNLEKAKKSPKFKLNICSVSDYNSIKEIFSQESFDFIFHTAALNLLRSLENPIGDCEINALGTIYLLRELAKANASSKFIFSSTGSVYGIPVSTNQDETHQMSPTSQYGASKLAANYFVKFWNEYHGLETISLRYYNVYGPRQSYDSKGGVVGLFISKLLQGKDLYVEGSGNQERCFTYVEDVVRANLLAGLSSSFKGESYNIASDEIITIKSLAEKLNSMFGDKSNLVSKPRRVGDIDIFRPSIDKARIELDYVPAINLNVGLEKTIKWIKHVEEENKSN